MNIGVMGGTFDPIHNGHLVIAAEVRTRLNLAEILFMPAGQPWLKMNWTISAAEHRINMVQLAIEDNPYFRLSTMEVERSGPTYTVDTVTELKSQLGAGGEIFLILGWDSLTDLPQWREPSRLIEMCHLVVVPRPGYSNPNLKRLEASIPGLSQRVILLDSPRLDINSSAIRDRVARGLSIGHLVPESVDRYIREHKLYITKQ